MTSFFDKLQHDQIARYLVGMYPEDRMWDTWKWSELSESILPAYHKALRNGYKPYITGNHSDNMKTIQYIMSITNQEYINVYKYLQALESGMKDGGIDAEIWNPQTETEIDSTKSLLEFDPVKITGKKIESQFNKILIIGGIATIAIFLGRAYIFKKVT